MKSHVKWILLTVFLAVVFCGSFVYFYSKKQSAESSPVAEVEKKNENPLPEAKLFNLDSEILPDADLRKGKVVLIFVSPTCEACQAEGEFLKNLVEKRNDVKFYGVVSLGKPEKVLEASQGKFPFKIFYDGENLLTSKLGIRKVPIKIYLEDGVIKKVWGGATVDVAKQKEFTDWLGNV